MAFPDWSSVGNNLLADAIVIVAMSATVRTAVRRVGRITLDRSQEIAFWLLVPTALALGLIALRLNAPAPVQVPFKAESTKADWSALDQSDINDWAAALKPFKIYNAEIWYAARDEDVAVSIGEAMEKAGWSEPELTQGVSVGIRIGAPSGQSPVAKALQALCEKKFGVRPPIDGNSTFLTLIIGRRTNP
ncbi:hypothetical protein [Candidatus Binatus sp.]|jgi:hypothetical protein|uniref:hypothetical protein n=1 Tax=Candidatus Binatus sp. TaxID=2811406 RepID=UPI003BCB6E30